MRISVSADGALGVAQAFSDLPSKITAAQVRALSTLRRRWPVLARRDIQTEYALGARRINQDLRVRRTSSGLELVGAFRGIGLRNFAARQTRAGVTATIRRDERNLRESAFLATLLSGNRHAVRREGKKRPMTAGRYMGKRRQPLVVEYGPTVAQMLRKGNRPQRLAGVGLRVIEDELRRLLDRPLR